MVYDLANHDSQTNAGRIIISRQNKSQPASGMMEQVDKHLFDSLEFPVEGRRRSARRCVLHRLPSHWRSARSWHPLAHVSRNFGRSNASETTPQGSAPRLENSTAAMPPSLPWAASEKKRRLYTLLLLELLWPRWNCF